MGDLYEKMGLTPKRKGYWRLTDYLLGHVNGLPHFYGRLLATDGISCLILCADGEVREGHLEFFVPEEGVMVSAFPVKKKLCIPI
jgi:hypothetical protein